MFKFQLALRLGRTVAEIDNTMSAREFDMWQAFNVFEPIGVMREDALMANLIHMLAMVNGVDNKMLSDFMLFKDRDAIMRDADEEIQITQDDVDDVCVNLRAMFSKVV